MPPCGDTQQFVAADTVFVLRAWAEAHSDFVVGGNEAGLLFATGDIRAAEAAVWRRADLGPRTGGFQRVPPLLAVEVAGQDDSESELKEKALWYLARGVRAVWLVLPETREVLVMRPGVESRHRSGESLPSHPDLPHLQPEVAAFFRQLRD